MTTLRADEFRAWAQFVQSVTGISLNESKAYLIEDRLAGLLTTEGCADFGELFFRVRSERGTTLRRKVIDAITTGETLFFRDQNPFDALRCKILPELIDRRTRSRPADSRAQAQGPRVHLRIWSAACSTGQEVYSIAIVLRELLGDSAGYTLRLLGTDISDRAVAKASYGQFTNFEVERGMRPDVRDRFMEPLGQAWKIRDDLRSLATFRTQNLMEDFTSLGRFDIVFCRNVAIYFEEQDRISLFRRIGQALEPDGVLVIGATETLSNLCPEFEPKRYHRTVFYQRKID